MPVEWEWPKVDDKMSHEAEILSADTTISAAYNTGIADRRFKTGYRVVPHVVSGVMINFTVKRDARYQVRQLWNIGMPGTDEDLGKYCVVMIGPDWVKLMPVLSLMRINRIIYKPKMSFIYLGSIYNGEGVAV